MWGSGSRATRTGAAVRLRPAGRRRKQVGVRDVEEVVARMANIPAARATGSDRERLENLEADLHRSVFGQDAAISTVVRAVKRGRAGLSGPDRPIGCFLFTGPAGNGRKEIERFFSPEFRNRLDEVVTFESLGPEVMEQVVDKFTAEVEEQLSERAIALALTPAARTWLAKKGYDPLFGARPMARVIQTELKDRLVDGVLFGELSKGGRVEVDVGEKDRLVFRLIA